MILLNDGNVFNLFIKLMLIKDICFLLVCSIYTGMKVSADLDPDQKVQFA